MVNQLAWRPADDSSLKLALHGSISCKSTCVVSFAEQDSCLLALECLNCMAAAHSCEDVTRALAVGTGSRFTLS